MSAKHLPAKIDERRKQSSLEDEPMQRVFRQRQAVENQHHDNEVLRLDLTREQREAKKSHGSGKASNDVTTLQNQAALYVKKIEGEREKIEELDKEIAKYQERILYQKSKVGGVNAAQTNNQLIQKQIKVLEGRLDKSLLKFNEVLAQNKVLRQKIDEYRRERVVFDGIYKKLEMELHQKKKEMQAVIEDSKNAYEAREKAQNEMLTLKSHAEKEKSDFENDFKELGDLIKQQQYALEQLRLKQFERTNDDTHVMFEKSGSQEGESAQPIAWQGQKDKTALSVETVLSYEEELSKIQQATGIHDVNELVTSFLEAEEKNFSLFNYVNDVNTEIERLEHSTASMRNQIEKYRGQGMSTDNQRKKANKGLEDKLSKAKAKTDEYVSRYDRAVRTISQLKNGIHSIFTRIGAANTYVDAMLGSQGVTESNMMQYLGIIEQRTSEILQAYAVSQQALTNDQLLEFPSVLKADRNKLSVPLPSQDDPQDITAEDDESDDDRPLTRQELDKKTVRDFAKKLQLNQTA